MEKTMSHQDTGHDQVIHVCAHCKNKVRKDANGNDLPADERSALWMFAVLTPAEAADARYFESKKRPDGTPFLQFRHWKWKGNANPIHDGCKADMEEKVKKTGMTIAFWPSEELRAIWRDLRKERESEEKKKTERDELLAALLRGEAPAESASEEADEQITPAPARTAVVVPEETLKTPPQVDSKSWVDSMRAAKERLVG